MELQGKAEQESSELAMNFMADTYHSGAASVSYKRIAIIVGIIIVGIVTFIIIKNKKNDSGSDGTDGTDGNNGNNGQNGDNEYGNGDDDAAGGSCENNNAENAGCLDGDGSSPDAGDYPGGSSHVINAPAAGSSSSVTIGNIRSGNGNGPN